MNRAEEAEYLKKRVFEVINSKERDKLTNERIVTVNINPDLFVEMAYLFIAKHGT